MAPGASDGTADQANQKRSRYAWTLWAAACLLAPQAAAEAFSLFNGRDLTGWTVYTPGIWTARDGMIIGRHQGLAHNDFLRTAREFSDFVLTLEFRLLGGVGNSGIQFRSRAVAGSPEVSGYQADIGQRYWGCLYDESRRNRVLACPKPEALEGLDRSGWNQYRITAIGRKIRLELNGKETVSYEEPDPQIPQTGFIALQVHAAKEPIQVEFRNIRLEIPSAAAQADAASILMRARTGTANR